MEQHEINQIVAELPKGRTLFPYFKDQYALRLLSTFVGESTDVRTIKRSRFAGLLDKPILKNFLAQHGHDTITQDDLACIWPCEPEYYRLSLGIWGDSGYWGQYWQQTSRPGKNLVLQLNFPNKHNVVYQREIFQRQKQHPFRWSSHPVHRGDEYTLAWARLDIDPVHGIALIEEIQTDWIRSAKVRSRTQPDVRRYIEQALQTHLGMWDEAMLSATLWFLRRELGITQVYYHTVESGLRLKGFGPDESQPPRSLYSKLPRRFCFTKTPNLPDFLLRHRRVRREVRKGELRMYRLGLGRAS